MAFLLPALPPLSVILDARLNFAANNLATVLASFPLLAILVLLSILKTPVPSVISMGVGMMLMSPAVMAFGKQSPRPRAAAAMRFFAFAISFKCGV